MPKVSIIMPTYNRSWIIKRAINSVLGQTFQDFELIIIDDASTDDTVKKLKNIQDKRVVLHELKENKGQANARNEGIKKAKSDVIAYLDTDNIWFSNYLEVMLHELSNYYILVYSAQNLLLCSGDKKSLKVIARQIKDIQYNPDKITRANFIDINCTIHRKKLFKEVGMFDTNLKSAEDWDLFARIAVKYPFKIKHVSQVLGEYYFFLSDTSETIENEILGNNFILQQFNLINPRKDAKVIVEKINNLLGKKDSLNFSL